MTINKRESAVSKKLNESIARLARAVRDSFSDPRRMKYGLRVGTPGKITFEDGRPGL